MTASQKDPSPKMTSKVDSAIFLSAEKEVSGTSRRHPEEARGAVTRIIDGVTFEVSELGCVRLADVMSVNANSQAGLDAREFTRDNLMGTQVFQ